MWAYATVVVAYFFRVYRLADKNIWWDEGWSLWLSRQDPLAVALRTAADEHPPLHYWMLSAWNAVAGIDPGRAANTVHAALAGRFLSVWFGVLTVALLYRLGRRVGGAWVGVLAALLLALARFHVWWSQDIKNYTPSILLAFLAVWFALDLIERPGLKPVAGYALFAALALWTHYLAVMILVSVNAYALWEFARRQPAFAGFRVWIAAQCLGALLFLPWVILYLSRAATWTAAPAFDFALFLQLVATVLPLGVTTHIERYAGLTILLTTVAALGGAGMMLRRRAGSRGVLFALIVLIPPLLIYLMSLTPAAFFAPKVQARYLLVLLPAYVLLLALGLATLARFSRGVAVAATLLVVGANLWVLADYYAERRLGDDYTTIANTINALAQPGDVVLLNTDQEWPAFLYYLRPSVDWLGVPNGAPMDAASADRIAQNALARHDAVWLVSIPDALATDPARQLPARLRRDLTPQFEQTYDDRRLELYAREPRDLARVPAATFSPQYTYTGSWEGSLQLIGYDLPVRESRAGEVVRVVTYWNALQPGEAAIELKGIAAALASIPQGERVRHETDFVVPAGATGTVSVSAGGRVLGQVSIEPRAAAALGAAIANPTDVRWGEGIRLVGYDLPARQFRFGEQVPITLYWRADSAIGVNYAVFVHLLGAEFNPAHTPPNPLWGQVDRVPGDGTQPTTAWSPGQNVLDAYRVPIEPAAPPGRYQIEIGLYNRATGVRLALAGSGADRLLLTEIEIVR